MAYSGQGTDSVLRRLEELEYQIEKESKEKEKFHQQLYEIERKNKYLQEENAQLKKSMLQTGRSEKNIIRETPIN